MNILIFGANGRSGLPLLKAALRADHLVTAFVRSRSKIPAHLCEEFKECLTVVEGDVLVRSDVEAAFSTTPPDAVVSTLGPTKSSPDNLMPLASSNIISAMQSHGVRRLVWMTGAGVPGEGDEPKLINHIIKSMLRLFAGKVLAQSEAAVNEIRGSDLEWTVVRVPMLVDGEPTGAYRVGSVGVGTGAKLVRADGAAFILAELETRGYVGRSPVVSN